MRTRAELRRMRHERGEPGGFGVEEGVSLVALGFLALAAVGTVMAFAGVLLGWGGWWENVLP